MRDCGYTDNDRMLRDAIVIHSHKEISQKCLEKGDTLTLEMAIQIGQGYELSVEKMKTINDEDASVNQCKRASHSIHKNTEI